MFDNFKLKCAFPLWLICFSVLIYSVFWLSANIRIAVSQLTETWKPILLIFASIDAVIFQNICNGLLLEFLAQHWWPAFRFFHYKFKAWSFWDIELDASTLGKGISTCMLLWFNSLKVKGQNVCSLIFFSFIILVIL